MPIDNLSKITSRSGINTTILLEAGNANVTGIVTAAGFDGPFTGGSGSDINAGIVTAANGLHVGAGGTIIHALSEDNGKVGIGITNPYYNLQVNFNNANTALSGGGGGNWGGAGLRLENDNTTVGAMALAHFRVYDADWHIGNKYVGNNDSDFVFNHEGSEKLRIDSDGRVGIGTDAPDETLHIQSNSPVIKFSDGPLDSQIRADAADLKFIVGGTGKHFKFQTSVLHTSEVARITGDGKVGIGTDDPDGKLDVRGTIFVNGDGTGGRIFASGGSLSLTDGNGRQTFRIDDPGSGNTHIHVFDSNGHLGIGTDSPDHNLHLWKYGGDSVLSIESQGDGNHSAIEFLRTSSGGDSKGAGSIYVTGNTGASEAKMQFGVGHNIGHGQLPRMTIMGNGEVGIGTIDPGSILDVREDKDGAETMIRLFNTDNGDTTTQTAALYLSPDSRGIALTGLRAIKENASFATNAGRDVSLTLNTLQNNSQNEAVRITSAGRLLIGHDSSSGDFHGPQTTTGRNPYFQLHGANASNAGAALVSWSASSGQYYSPVLYLGRSGSATVGTNGLIPNQTFGSIVFSGDDGEDFVKGAMIVADVDGIAGINSMPGRLEFYTTASGAQVPTERLRITNAGLVQIDTPGVTAGNGASAKLQIDSSSQYDGLLLGNAATYGTISRGANNGALVYTANAYPANLGGGEKITHEWWSGNAGGGGPDQLMVLSASGKVGIGTSIPGTQLHLYGATPIIRLTDTDTSGPLHTNIDGASGDLTLDVGSVHRDVIITSVNQSNEIARFEGDGNVSIADGNLSFASGHGIDFSATSNSGNGTMGNELFDDYEEGTWTPSFNTANSSGTLGSLSYDIQEGRYIKIGSTVYIEGALRTTNVANNGNGTYDIAGLPFTNTSGGTDGVHGIIHCGSQHSWGSAPNSFDPIGGATYMRARGGIDVGDSTYTNGNTADFNTGTGSKNRVYFSGTYSVDF